MTDPLLPLAMRLMGLFGTTPEASARNAVLLLTEANARGARGAVLRKPKVCQPERIALDEAKAAKLWAITTSLASRHGVVLP